MFAFPKKLGSYVCIASIACVISTTPALAHNITFNTNFSDPTAGPGMILEQSTVSAARIFQYVEDDLYATAIRNTDPESHFHLFGNGIVIGGDSEGVAFTFGGPTPTTPFNVESLEVLELGTVNTFFTPFMGSTAGTPVQVTSTGLFNFNENAWNGISHFIASFETPGPGSRLDFTNLDLHQAETAPVPEPGTIGLFGIGLVGLGLMRYRKNAKTK
ncbi:MAG: PEP-CTERM sorting domain-containing protein [Nitrospirales bacterium]